MKIQIRITEAPSTKDTTEVVIYDSLGGFPRRFRCTEVEIVDESKKSGAVPKEGVQNKQELQAKEHAIPAVTKESVVTKE